MNSRTRKFTIGRDQNCDVAIADDSVSRVHAELTLQEGGSLSLSDRGSSNGTVLIRQGAAKVLEHERLLAADRLRFGRVEISLQDLIGAIERKHPELAGAFTGGGAGAADRAANAAARAPRAQPAAGKLVRCECGSIKKAGEICKTCGS